jgi:hypothetical protein
MTGVVLKMSPQSVIAGKVLDEDGEPVPNTQVRALKMGYRNGRKQWVQAGSGSTSDIGEYRIPALEPGRYLVTTNQSNRSLAMNMMRRPDNTPLPDGPEMRYAATYYPSTADQTTAVPVDVTPGAEVRGIDIRLVKTQVFRVRGRVAAPDSSGRFPMVMLVSRDGARTVPSMGPARPPDFRFEIAGVAPGSYVAVAQMGGRGEQSVAWQQVEVRGGHVDGLLLTPAQGAEVGGTVKVEEATGTVDLSRVNVTLRPTIAELGNPPRARVGAGTFAMKNVAPMQYTVAVSGLPEGCWVKSIQYGGQEVPAEGATISGGAIDITLSATAGDIAAAVVDKDGNPVAGATVALIGAAGPIQGSTADENGAVTFRGLKPGDYTVIAWDDVPPGAHMDPEFVKNYSGASVKLEARGKPAVQVKAATVQ